MADQPQTTAPAPVIGPGARFEGTLSFRGEARVEGEVKGWILARGRLEVAPGARVEARVEADEVVVGGTLEGDVDAPIRLTLLPGGSIRGNVRTPKLVLADGSTLDGHCEVTKPGPPAVDAGTGGSAASRETAPAD